LQAAKGAVGFGLQLRTTETASARTRRATRERFRTAMHVCAQRHHGRGPFEERLHQNPVSRGRQRPQAAGSTTRSTSSDVATKPAFPCVRRILIVESVPGQSGNALDHKIGLRVPSISQSLDESFFHGQLRPRPQVGFSGTFSRFGLEVAQLGSPADCLAPRIGCVGNACPHWKSSGRSRRRLSWLARKEVCKNSP